MILSSRQIINSSLPRSAGRGSLLPSGPPPTNTTTTERFSGRSLGLRRVIEIGHQQQTAVHGLYGFAPMLLDCEINGG